jgi:hypothetical protein
MSAIFRLVNGGGAGEISMSLSGLWIGIIMLCMSQFFAHGVALEEDVDGLV